MRASTSPSSGIAFTWHVNSPDAFWRAYETQVWPLLKTAHTQGEVHVVLPLSHSDLSLPNSAEKWNATAIIVCSDEPVARELARQLTDLMTQEPLSLHATLKAVDLFAPQKNVDMYYQARNGLKREPLIVQWIEYVASVPEHRSEYYAASHDFVGPAMRRLHAKNCASRFVGFELTERLYRDKPQTPDWDMVHIAGFTRLQLITVIPHFHRAFDDAAQAVWGAGAVGKEKMASLEKMRTLAKDKARQHMRYTLQSPDL